MQDLTPDNLSPWQFSHFPLLGYFRHRGGLGPWRSFHQLKIGKWRQGGQPEKGTPVVDHPESVMRTGGGGGLQAESLHLFSFLSALKADCS